MAERNQKLDINFNLTNKDAQELYRSEDPEAWLRAYIRKKYNLPPQAEIDLSGVKIKEVPGVDDPNGS